MKEYIPDTRGITHLDHTADIWLSARSDDIPSVISLLVDGIYGMIAGSFSSNGIGVEHQMELDGPDLETVMVDLLNEILFIFDSESKILIERQININEVDDRVLLKINSISLPVSIPHGQGGTEVKAVTYHGSSINDGNKNTEAIVLLDL